MKALTLTQPYATLMAHRLKVIETRSWAPPEWLTGQAVAIHAGKGLGPVGGERGLRDLLCGEPFLSSLALALEVPADPEIIATRLPRGAFVAEATLTVVMATERIRDVLVAAPSPERERELRFGDYSPGRFGWRFRDVHRLPRPIACRGALGLWEVPEEIAASLAETALAQGRDHL